MEGFPSPSRRNSVQFGGLCIGFVIPCILLALYNARNPYPYPMLIGGCFVFGALPGMLIASLSFRVLLIVESGDLLKSLGIGAALGVAPGLFNYYAYDAVQFCDADYETRYIRLISAMCATGGACGYWGGWQAWKARTGDSRWLPSISLGGLLLLFLFCSILVGLFFPTSGEKTTIQLIFSAGTE